MFDESRINIYNYLYDLFHGVVTENVYSIREPQELTKSDTTNGFIVINVGDLHDDSEFDKQAYGWARCFVYAYIPPTKRGKLDFQKFASFENEINNVINSAMSNRDGKYGIRNGSVLSADGSNTSNANNSYFTFAKSFIVEIS